MADAKNITVTIAKKADEAFGAVPNDKLIIVKVQEGSPADGKLLVGDKVLKVNDAEVTDLDQYQRQMAAAGARASLLVMRDSKKAQEVGTLVDVSIPPERERFIMRREGYSYQMVRIEIKPGLKLGLGVMHYQNRVLVSRVDPNGASAGQLKVCDHLIDVDGQPVSDKEVYKCLLVRALRKNHFFTTVVERPISPEAQHWVKSALIAACEVAPPVDVDDGEVAQAAAKQMDRMKTDFQPKKAMVVGSEQKRATIAGQDPKVFRNLRPS